MTNGILEVRWWDGRLVGRLSAPGPVYFEYDPQWLHSGYDLSPISLPFASGAQRKKDPFFNSLPGMIADSLPDSWGEAVMRKVFEQQKLGRVTPLKALAWIGSGGIGALSFAPEFPAGRPPRSWEAAHAELLAREARAVVRGDPASVFPRIAASGGSVGGARPKALVALEADGQMVFGGDTRRLKTATFHILKFDQSADGGEAQCEHAYALMAAAAGIDVALTRLIPAQDPETPARCHLLVERFDTLPSGARRHIHTLCGLLERPARLLDYADFVRATLRIISNEEASKSAVRAVIRRMVFNNLAANDDDHGKNHAFMLLEGAQEWRLTPAYDLTFSPDEHAGERGMGVHGETGVPSRKQLAELAADAGIKAEEFADIFKNVIDTLAVWPEFAARAELNPQTTDRIKQVLTTRIQAVS
jgi:serine/threonine-protein kinase HipA